MADTATADVLREPEAPASWVPPLPTAPPQPPEVTPGMQMAGSALGIDPLAGYQAAQKKQQDALAARNATVGPQIDRAIQAGEQRVQAVAENPPPAAPAIPPPPPNNLHAFLAPTEGEPPEQSVSKFITALGLFATGIGGMVKGDARGSLAALTGALEGWHAGDKEKADREFAKWKATTDAMLKNAKLKREEWQDWFSATGLSVDQAVQGARLFALKHDLAIDLTKADVEGQKYIIDTMIEMKKHEDAVAASTARIAEAHANREAQRDFLERMKLEQREFQQGMARERRAEATDERRQRDEERKSEKLEKAAQGNFYDVEQGRVRQVTEGEHQADLKRVSAGEAPRFKHMALAQEQALDRLVLAPSIYGRLAQLVDKILAAAPGENITQGLLNKLKQKGGFDADIAEFQNLSADSAVELASALSGGQPRISILNMIRGEAQPGLTMTQDAAKRQIATGTTTIKNRLTALTGDPAAWEKLGKGLSSYGGDKVNVIGPDGQPGTVPKGTDLAKYPGWRLAE